MSENNSFASAQPSGVIFLDMEQLGIRLDGNNLVIDGLPEGVVKIASFSQLLPVQSFHLSSFAGHRVDLTFAKTCLDLINAADSNWQKALWRVAVIYYCKCFSQTNKRGVSDQVVEADRQSSANRPGRRPLHPNKVLKNDVQGQARHRHFMALRDKHLVHDENGWLQAITAVAIASPDKNYNVERVIYTVLEGGSLRQEDLSNLSLLIEKALSWVNSEIDGLCIYITNELEKVPRERLLSQPNVKYRSPEAEEVHLPR
jgi:hypothetical protein